VHVLAKRTSRQDTITFIRWGRERRLLICRPFKPQWPTREGSSLTAQLVTPQTPPREEIDPIQVVARRQKDENADQHDPEPVRKGKSDLRRFLSFGGGNENSSP
jgi:hypothetical protein